MLPPVLGFDALHPATVISCLWSVELHHHLRVPPAGSLQEGCLGDPKRQASIHPCGAESVQRSVRRLLGAQRSPLVLTHHSEAFWGNAGLEMIPPPSLEGKHTLT